MRKPSRAMNQEKGELWNKVDHRTSSRDLLAPGLAYRTSSAVFFSPGSKTRGNNGQSNTFTQRRFVRNVKTPLCETPTSIGKILPMRTAYPPASSGRFFIASCTCTDYWRVMVNLWPFTSSKTKSRRARRDMYHKFFLDGSIFGVTQ